MDWVIVINTSSFFLGYALMGTFVLAAIGMPAALANRAERRKFRAIADSIA